MDIFRRARKDNGRQVTRPVSDQSDQVEAKPANLSRRRLTLNKLIATSWRQRAILGVGALVVAIGLFFGIKIALAAHHIIAKSKGGAPALNGNLGLTQLKGEGDGRINILVLGIGGKGWDGPYLSDTMMVVSIDPRTKDVAMLSIPRDLYVKIPNYGWSKINAADAVGEQRKTGSGPDLSQTVVQNILGIPIHYYVRVDFAGFKQAVDTVGGVNINVDKALYDPYYPGTVVNIKPGLQHMNGNLALEYARSRKTTSDFDRAARQQKVLVALKDKAFSLQTVSNPAKIAGLIDTFGDNVRTDMQISEMKKLESILQGVDSSKITSKVLDTGSPDSLLKDGSGTIPGAGSIEVPIAGLGNYTAIQAYAHSIFADSYIKGENATIEVQNGTLQSGLATTVGALLKTYNYNVISVVTAPQQNHAQTIIYDYTNGKKPYTINYLENRFGVKAQKAVRGPSDPDISIVVGASYKAPSTSSTY